MADDDRSTRLPSLLALLAAARVLAFAVLERRPLFGGAEAADLQRSMFYHYGLRGHLDWTFLEQVSRDGFKPPLWYAGIPLLFGWKDTLSAADYLVVHAGIAAGIVLLAAALGARIGGRLGAILAALLAAFWPGIAGGVTRFGVEPLHALCLLALLLGSDTLRARARQGLPLARPAAALGGVLALGLLAKWNFAAYAALPLLVVPLLVPRVVSGGRARAAAAVAGAALLGAVGLALWLVPFAELREILQQGADGEPSFPHAWSSEALLYLPRQLWRGVGGPVPAWLVLAVVFLLGARFAREKTPQEGGPTAAPPPPPRPADAARTAMLVLVAALGLLALHTALPHKEARYLLPALATLAALTGGLVGPAFARRPAFLLGVGVAALSAGWIPSLRLDPRPSYRLDDLSLAPVRDDFGLEALVAHPSLRRRARTVVTTSLDPDGRFPVLTFLNWELYARNPNPVLSRSDWEDVTSRACAYDLERSTHFITNRVLNREEDVVLRGMGFLPVARVSPRIDGLDSDAARAAPEGPAFVLWALRPDREPTYR